MLAECFVVIEDFGMVEFMLWEANRLREVRQACVVCTFLTSIIVRDAMRGSFSDIFASPINYGL